jgi:hypothetical protein
MSLSKERLRWIVAGLSIVAAVRVFVFAAAFPFFNNVDEQAHMDLVVRYADHSPPHGIENFSSEAARYFAIYRSPEYFVSPDQYGGRYPPPNWRLPRENLQEAIDNESAVWKSRSNHESGEPAGYYAVAGTWFDFGKTLGLRGLTALYWVRFLNVAIAAGLVWLGFRAARIIFPDQEFYALATATLLAIWPQTSFYSIQGDSLSPLFFAIGFVALAGLFQMERPTAGIAIRLGLPLAAICLVKTANLPLLVVVTIGVIWKTVKLVRETQTRRALAIFATFIVSVAVPLGIWFTWNENHFGDLTATKSKIELLGWTPKPFADWWSHPIFSPSGATKFWTELIASFWRGEFIWHGERMARWWSDGFYWAASTIALAIAIISLAIRRKSEPKPAILWFAVLSFASLVGFLVLLSIRFDFGQCPYPSRENPFFTSGRLLNAAAVPFFILFVYAMGRIADWTKRRWMRWGLLALAVILIATFQLVANAPAFSSQYNFFHRPAGEQ